jgi:hypothetical protein
VRMSRCSDRSSAPRSTEPCGGGSPCRGLHYFVFALAASNAEPIPGVAGPSALFTMRPGERTPAAALLVTPIPGGFAEVRDVRHPETVETLPLG